MADDRLTELRGLQAAPADLGTVLADGAVALALGLLAAWGIVQVIGLMTTRTPSPEQAALHRLDRIAETGGVDGVTARARLLHDLGRALPVDAADAGSDWLTRVDRHLDGFLSRGAGAGLRDALYRPGATLDMGRFDSDLRACLSRAGR